MSNVDPLLEEYKRRLLNLEKERKEIGELIKDLAEEFRGKGVKGKRASGAKLAVKWELETTEKREARLEVEDIAKSLGDFADMPLAVAAINAANNYNPGVTQ